MATVQNDKDVFLLAASPRFTVVTVPYTNVTGQIDGTPASTVRSNAATGSAHASTTGNPHNVSLIQIAGDLDDISNGSTYFKSTADQNTGGGRAFNALDSTNTYIKSLVSTKLTVVGANPTTGWVGDSSGLRLYQSSVLKVNIPVSGAPSFSGDITGGANINITGSAQFNGNTTFSGSSRALVANGSRNQLHGVLAFDGTAGNGGAGGFVSTGSNGVGVTANASGTNGIGVNAGATGSGGIAVQAVAISPATALSIFGPMKINNTTLVTNLNADMVDGIHASALCNKIFTNTGTCTVSGGGLNLTVTGTLGSTVRTRGTGNDVFIENISDERLKQDIQDEELGLDFVMKLRPRSFRMRSDPALLSHGFIHQEVCRLVSRQDGLASINSDGTGAFDYNGITSPIVKSIQELYNDNVRLLERVQHLEEILNVS